MIVKPVNAGEKTMDEIKEMIKNLDDDTMISICLLYTSRCV